MSVPCYELLRCVIYRSDQKDGPLRQKMATPLFPILTGFI